MKAALYALHYIHSMHDYGISFTSDAVTPMHCYVHFPPSTDIEAYTVLFLRHLLHCPLFLPTVTHAGDRKLEALLQTGPFFLFSSFEA